MEFRNLEITVCSAKDLKDVNMFSKMDVFVVAMIAEDPRSEQKTPIDKDGGKSPKWNHKMNFVIDESAAKENRSTLVFRIKSDRTLGDRDIGEVTVHVKDLLGGENDEGEKTLTCSVRTPSGKEKGTLKLFYRIGDKVDVPAPAPEILTEKHVGGEPVMAYPTIQEPNYGYQQQPPPMYYQPPPPGSAPPPMYYQPPYPGGQPPYPGGQPPYPGGAPPMYAPQAGYPMQGYPPMAQGYGGYPPQQMGGYGYPAEKKKKKSGMGGLGLGLGAGLLGGLLVGEMVSDVGEMAAADAMGDADFDF